MSSLKTKTDQTGRTGARSPATTLDDFLGGRISVSQPKAGHRAGSDAVWLQAAVPCTRASRYSTQARASGWQDFVSLPASLKFM